MHSQEMSRPASDDAPFSALAFKIMSDPFVGSLSFIRIYSGTLEVREMAGWAADDQANESAG